MNVLNSHNLKQARERSDMDMNSIESNTLAAMMVEQDLLDWLQEDESIEYAEESVAQIASGHA